MLPHLSWCLPVFRPFEGQQDVYGIMQWFYVQYFICINSGGIFCVEFILTKQV